MLVILRLAASTIMFVILAAVHAACAWGHVSSMLYRRRGARKLRVLAIGSFYHRNWYESHLTPLASATVVGELLVVSGERGSAMDGVTWCVAPQWIRRVMGMHASRALWALLLAIRCRPDVIVGYFICPNALLALLISRLVGAKSCYQMCGGPREFVHCGADSGNSMLRHVIPSFPLLERMLYSAIGKFDLIVVRGERGRASCRDYFAKPAVRIIPGAIDPKRFRPCFNGKRLYDLMTVCRLARVKRLDVFLRAIAEVVESRPKTRAVIVGDGPERVALEALAGELALKENVEFAGTRDDVETFHRQSRMYVVTSDDEGLSIALAEAMASGLPAVVTDVGELGELVKDERNGFLIPAGNGSELATRVLRILSSEDRANALGEYAARDAFDTCGLPRVTDLWNEVLSEVA